ncbi:MAG: serine/threonine-protein kinase, partial [Planctomycetota bacterium]
MEGNLLGAYRIESKLGAGGMGTVYLATVEEDVAGLSRGEPVALKVIHESLVEKPSVFRRFLREGEAGRQVRHENVVRTLRAETGRFEDQDLHFLVMEYVKGRTLRDLLEELGTVPESLLREIARQVAAGVAAIHAVGVVHRDLKPENVLITEDHQVRIMDLGVARIVDESLTMTQEGQFAGSLLYAAPEQFKAVETGPVADLYSMGVVLYELATGENPFRRDVLVGVINAHLQLVP